MLFARHLEQDRRLLRFAAAPPQPHRAGIARGRDVAARRRCCSSRVSRRASSRRPWPRAGRSRPPRRLRLARSNSRNTTASLPPRDRRTIARSCVPGRVAAPPQIQSSPSAAASASRSSRISQSGWSRAEALERGAPPQAARIRGVESRNCRATAAPADERDACRAGRGSPPGCRGRRRTARRRRSVSVRAFSAVDPGERAFALDLLEPEIGIVVRLHRQSAWHRGTRDKLRASHASLAQRQSCPAPRQAARAASDWPDRRGRRRANRGRDRASASRSGMASARTAADPAVSSGGVARRHGEHEIALGHHAEGREVVAAAQADMAALAVLAELDVLGARTAAARRHHDVLLGQIRRQGEARPHPRMGLAGGDHEAVGADALAMDALRQRQGDVDRGIERAVGQAGLDAAAADLHRAQVDARRFAREAPHQPRQHEHFHRIAHRHREARLASAPGRSCSPLLDQRCRGPAATGAAARSGAW